jgi:hypothetical protein
VRLAIASIAPAARVMPPSSAAPLDADAADAADAALRAALGGGPWRWQALHASGFTATWSATRAGERLFVKTLPGKPAQADADADARDGMLAAEADGLAALAATRTVRVPAVTAVVPAGEGFPALLALEWLDLVPPDAGFGARFGVALAALHRAPVDPPRYGWPRDNFLGATPQRNTPTAGAAPDDWLGFVAHCRLRAMVDGLRRTDADARTPAPARSGRRKWVRQLRSGPTTAEQQRIKELEREVRELARPTRSSRDRSSRCRGVCAVDGPHGAQPGVMRACCRRCSRVRPEPDPRRPVGRQLGHARRRHAGELSSTRRCRGPTPKRSWR